MIRSHKRGKPETIWRCGRRRLVTGITRPVVERETGDKGRWKGFPIPSTTPGEP